MEFTTSVMAAARSVIGAGDIVGEDDGDTVVVGDIVGRVEEYRTPLVRSLG